MIVPNGPAHDELAVIADIVTSLVAAVATLGARAEVAGLTVLDHKPGRRTVLGVGLARSVVLRGGDGLTTDRLFAKVFADERLGASAHETLTLLWDRTRAGDASFGLPQPLVFRNRPAVLLVGAVHGTPLIDAVRAGSVLAAGGPSDRERWAALGRWMARLHTSDAPLPRRYDIGAELRTLRAWSSEIADAGAPRGLVDRYDAIVERAADEARPTDAAGCSSTSSMRGPIHRDLHHEHAFVNAAGSVGVIDLDEARIGDPHTDLGHVYAYLTLASLAPTSVTAVFDGWRDATGDTIVPGAMSSATALACAKIARQRSCGFGPAPRPTGIERWREATRALDLATEALRAGIAV